MVACSSGRHVRSSSAAENGSSWFVTVIAMACPPRTLPAREPLKSSPGHHRCAPSTPQTAGIGPGSAVWRVTAADFPAERRATRLDLADRVLIASRRVKRLGMTGGSALVLLLVALA